MHQGYMQAHMHQGPLAVIADSYWFPILSLCQSLHREVAHAADRRGLLARAPGAGQKARGGALLQKRIAALASAACKLRQGLYLLVVFRQVWALHVISHFTKIHKRPSKHLLICFANLSYISFLLLQFVVFL